MALWDLSPKITILARHTTKRPYFSGEHLFFRVKGGTGALRMEMSRDPTCADPMLDTYQTLTLNGTPLALIQASGCPTCQSLLAAGHGLPVDCPQLRQAADAIAAPFDHLEEALERLAPVTGLLPSGYFILSLVDCYPTDGSGHFFWDIPNGFTLSPASTLALERISPAVWCALGAGMAGSLPLGPWLNKRLRGKWLELSSYAGAAALFVLCLLAAAGSSFQPFIYAQF